MSLQDQITNGWKDAMKSGQNQRRDVFSGLRAAIKDAEIQARSASSKPQLRAGTGNAEPGTPLDDLAVQKVVEREAKKRRDAIEEYGKVNREDRAQTEREELEILQEFLPAQLSSDELENIVRETIAEANASSPKDMGAVMKLLAPKIAGIADGKTASETVKRLLSS